MLGQPPSCCLQIFYSSVLKQISHILVGFGFMAGLKRGRNETQRKRGYKEKML